ncbi:hypothetical protein J4216_00135 [Candidatus Woesearchaeota archaeon]|nr:hypothetical protein [Candidatus Woesearchaeota archaeon]
MTSKFILKSILLAISISVAALSSVKEARAEVESRKAEIMESVYYKPQSIEDRARENVLRIEEEQAQLESQARWLDNVILPELEAIKKYLEIGNNNQKELAQHKIYLEELLYQIRGRHREISLKLFGEEGYNEFVRSIRELLAFIDEIQGEKLSPNIEAKKNPELEKLSSSLSEFFEEVINFDRKYSRFETILRSGQLYYVRMFEDFSKLKDVEGDLRWITKRIERVKKNEKTMKKLLGEKKYNELLNRLVLLKDIIEKISDRYKT